MLQLLSKALGKGTQKRLFFLTGYRYTAGVGIPYKPIWVVYPFLGAVLAAIWVGQPNTVYNILLLYATYIGFGLAWKHVGQNLLYLWDCWQSQRGEKDVTVCFIEDAPPLMRQARTLVSWDGDS